MKDIFKILQHESEEHELEIIKIGGKSALGCKTCGVTLISQEDFNEATNTTDTVNLIKLLKERNSRLFIILKDMIDMIIGDDDFIIYKIDPVWTRIKELIEKAEKNKDKKELNHRDGYYSFNCEILYSFAMNPLILKEIYSKEEFAEYKMKIKLDVIDKLQYRKSNAKLDDKIFITESNSYRVGALNYEDLVYYQPYNIYIFFTDILEKLLKDCPEPTGIYKFKDMNDYWNVKPKYEDEEGETPKYYEFIYRTKNNLYDFSNIDTKDVMQDILDNFDVYDYMDGTIETFKYMMKNEFDIELK